MADPEDEVEIVVDDDVHEPPSASPTNAELALLPVYDAFQTVTVEVNLADWVWDAIVVGTNPGDDPVTGEGTSGEFLVALGLAIEEVLA